MSIVRIGLAETKKFAEGYEAIFGKSKSGEAKSESEAGAKGAKKGAARTAKKKGKKK